MLGHKILRENVGGELRRDLDIAHLCRDKEVVRNNIEARCQVFQGEIKQNVLIGIPIGSSKEEIDLSVMYTTETTVGVSSINRFESKLVNRAYKLSMTVVTDFDEEVGVEI